MTGPTISADELSRLRDYIDREVALHETTLASIDPVAAPKSEGAALRDDWEQYGGHPGHTAGSSRTIKIIFATVMGYIDGKDHFPTLIVGKEEGKQKHYPLKSSPISFIDSISSDKDEILWSGGRSTLDIDERDKPVVDLLQVSEKSD